MPFRTDSLAEVLQVRRWEASAIAPDVLGAGFSSLAETTPAA